MATTRRLLALVAYSRAMEISLPDYGGISVTVADDLDPRAELSAWCHDREVGAFDCALALRTVQDSARARGVALRPLADVNATSAPSAERCDAAQRGFSGGRACISDT